jgi:hypothetical protein
MTAADARHLGITVPIEVPDCATLVGENVTTDVVASDADRRRLVVKTTITGARWEWVAVEVTVQS